MELPTSDASSLVGQRKKNFMQSHLDHPQSEQAADYVLNQLDDSQMASVERDIKTDAKLRLTVKELSDAAAAIAYATKQTIAPVQGNPINKLAKVETNSEAGTKDKE